MIRYVLPSMDDVIFAHKPRLLGHRPDEVQRTRSLGLGYKMCIAGQRMHGTTFRALFKCGLCVCWSRL